MKAGEVCRCGSCEYSRKTRAPGYVCAACSGTGRALAIDGSLRPCSRCHADDFTAWYAKQRALSTPEAGQR